MGEVLFIIHFLLGNSFWVEIGLGVDTLGKLENKLQTEEQTWQSLQLDLLSGLFPGDRPPATLQ